MVSAREPWRYRLVDQVPPGIDLAQLEQTRRMPPTEQLDAVVALIELGDRVKWRLA